MKYPDLEFLARALLFTRTCPEDPEEELKLEEPIAKILSHHPPAQVKRFFQKELTLTDTLLSSGNPPQAPGEAIQGTQGTQRTQRTQGGALRMVVERRITSRQELFLYKKALLRILGDPKNEPGKYQPQTTLTLSREEASSQTLKWLRETHPGASIQGIMASPQPQTPGQFLYLIYFGFRYREHPDIIAQCHQLSARDPEGARFFLNEEIKSIANHLAIIAGTSEPPEGKKSTRTILAYKEFLETTYL